jgi:Protein of unknown function (DUF559)
VGKGGERSEPGEGLMPQDMHHRPVANRIRNFAKKMRHEPTDAETAMWRLLRDRRLSQFKFRRQVPFQNFISFASTGDWLSKSMAVSIFVRAGQCAGTFLGNGRILRPALLE